MNPDEKNEVENIKAQDLSAAEIERVVKPKKTWFFERMGDGFIFPCEIREAWDICNNRSTWKRRDFRLLGTSDGTTYHRIVQESMTRAKELEPIINTKKEELAKYMRAEEKLIMDEAVDMEGDPSDTENEINKKKVLRLHGIMDRLHTELDSLEEEFKTTVSDIVTRAQAAELQVAKKNQAALVKAGEGLDWPDEDLNIITPKTSPKVRNKILGIMSSRKG